MDIPLKKVTIAQVIKLHSRGIKTNIKDLNYIGTEVFFMSEKYSSKEFINRINRLNKVIEVNGKVFEDYANSDGYRCSDDEVNYKLSEDKSIIILSTQVGNIGLNYNYYSYFKKLGVSLKFNNCVNPVGMFKDNEFIGILMPIKIREE